MPFGVWTWVGPRNHVFSGGLDPPRGGAFLGGIFWAVVKYREYLACIQYSQRYSVGVSYYVVFRC